MIKSANSQNTLWWHLACASLLTGLVGQVAADEYVPPPAGPYKPVAVMGGAQAVATDSAGKVYRFPSEDMIRSEAPAPMLASEEPVTVTERPAQAPADFQQADSATAALTPSSAANPQQPTTGFSAANPWAVATPQGQAMPAPAYQPPNQAWYPQYAYPQQYPYGYGYPDYYNNSNSGTEAPYSNMPTPWSMMPMQPFFSGR